MVAPSKLFIHPLNCYHCSQLILHPGVGCFRNCLNNLFLFGMSSLKYFSPLLITPLFLKYKSINREFIVHIFKNYLQTVFGGSLACSCVFLCICFLRNLVGEFRTYTTLFIPGVVGLQFCWLFPTRVLKLFTTATSQAVLEGLLLQYSNKFTHLILHSPMVQTILFMLNSSIILHYERKNIYKDFWFIQPHGKLNETTKNTEPEILLNGKTEDSKKYFEKLKTKCDHTNVSCGKFLLNGIKSYMFYGISLDLLTMLMKGKLARRSESFMQKLIEKFKTFRPNITGFFITYIGIYQLSSCLLRKYYSHLSLDVQHLLSAFLGGFSFMCVKRVNILSLSLVISIQLLWQQFCSSIKTIKSGRKPNIILQILKNAPVSQMIFSLNGGYLVHNYIFNYHLVNSLARGFLDSITHNKIKLMRKSIINNDMQTLIEMAKACPVKTFL